MKKIIVLVIINIVCIGLCYDLYKYNISLDSIDLSFIVMLGFMSMLSIISLVLLIWYILNYWKLTEYIITSYYKNIIINTYSKSNFIQALYLKHRLKNQTKQDNYSIRIVRKCYL